MSLSPEQFTRSVPMYHGNASDVADTHLRSSAERGLPSNFDASDRSKVYATPDGELAWNYAEHLGSMHLNRIKKPFRDAKLNGKLAWSSDPSRTDLHSPRRYQVEMEGAVDVDPNWEVHDAPVEGQKAFRADRARIVRSETIPVGSQTSMLPNPLHGGRYVRPGELEQNEDLAQAMGQLTSRKDRARMVPDTNENQLSLFDKSVGRDEVLDEIASILGGPARRA